MHSVQTYFVSFTLILLPLWVSAQNDDSTHYEIHLNSHALNLDISEKRGPRYSDDFINAGIVLGAYRESGRNRYWGAVVEYATELNRDAPFGDGTVIGFRPVNYLIDINDRYAAEFYLGASQIKWEKTARGYYLGCNLRWKMRERLSLALDYRWHQDMAYDSPLGDVIIQGASVGGGLVFHF